MHYINPFQLLGITAENISDIDNVTINKAKRKLLAEIELSDTNAIVHSGVELNKGDCLKAIDDLDTKIKREFHFYILQNKLLNNFLTSRDLTFFAQFKVESIFKDNEFLDFISPYFSEQYDKALIENYKKCNLSNLKSLLSINPIVNNQYSEKCHQSTYLYLREINLEIEKIKKEIESSKSLFIRNYFDGQGISKYIENKLNVSFLNILPNYFQGIRNQITQSISILAVYIHNELELYHPAFEVIQIGYDIASDGLDRGKIVKNYFILKKHYENALPPVQSPSTTISNYVNTPTPPISNIKPSISSEEKKTIRRGKPDNLGVASVYMICSVWALFSPYLMNIIIYTAILWYGYRIIKYYYNVNKKKEIKTDRLVLDFILLGILFGGISFPFLAILYITYNLIFIPIEICYNYYAYKSVLTFANYFVLILSFIILINIYPKITDKAEKAIKIASLTDKEHYEKGQNYFSQKNYSDAIIQFSEAIKLNSSYDDAYIARGASKANIELLHHYSFFD